MIWTRPLYSSRENRALLVGNQKAVSGTFGSFEYFLPICQTTQKCDILHAKHTKNETSILESSKHGFPEFLKLVKPNQPLFRNFEFWGFQIPRFEALRPLLIAHLKYEFSWNSCREIRLLTPYRANNTRIKLDHDIYEYLARQSWSILVSI